MAMIKSRPNSFC